MLQEMKRKEKKSLNEWHEKNWRNIMWSTEIHRDRTQVENFTKSTLEKGQQLCLVQQEPTRLVKLTAIRTVWGALSCGQYTKRAVIMKHVSLR